MPELHVHIVETEYCVKLYNRKMQTMLKLFKMLGAEIKLLQQIAFDWQSLSATINSH